MIRKAQIHPATFAVQLMAACKRGPVTVSEVASITGCDRVRAQDWLPRMAEAGALRREKRVQKGKSGARPHEYRVSTGWGAL